MSIDPSEWIPLAEQAARGSGADSEVFDDCVGAVLVDYSTKPPTSAGEAYNRGVLRSIDYLRKWTGYGNPQRDRRDRLSVPAGCVPQQYLQAGAIDDRLEAVGVLDWIERANLTPAQRESVAAKMSGFSMRDLDRVNGNAHGAASKSLYEARIRLRSRNIVW